MKKLDILRFLKKISPPAALSLAKAFRGDFNFKGDKQACPYCAGNVFLWSGTPPAISLECRTCGSSSRERIFFWAINTGLLVLSEPILHFAAEKNLENFLRKRFCNYSSADKHFSADLVLDIENINLQSKTQGTIIAFHVLDLTDIQAALIEIRRILRDGGQALIAVEQSDSYLISRRISSREQWEAHTLRHYDGQRFIAGLDFQKILAEYFNSVRAIRPPQEVAVSMGIFPVETIFLVTK